MDEERFSPERIRCDALFLSNSVENRQGLLYVLGGAWTRTWPQQGGSYPFDRTIPMVGILRVPFAEANVEHNFVLTIRDSDRKELVRAEGAFKVGRDVDLTAGMSQVVPMAMAPPVRLESAGIYYVTILVDGEELHQIEFEALAGPPQQRGG